MLFHLCVTSPQLTEKKRVTPHKASGGVGLGEGYWLHESLSSISPSGCHTAALGATQRDGTNIIHRNTKRVSRIHHIYCRGGRWGGRLGVCGTGRPEQTLREAQPPPYTPSLALMAPASMSENSHGQVCHLLCLYDALITLFASASFLSGGNGGRGYAVNCVTQVPDTTRGHCPPAQSGSRVQEPLWEKLSVFEALANSWCHYLYLLQSCAISPCFLQLPISPQRFQSLPEPANFRLDGDDLKRYAPCCSNSSN